LVTNMSDDIEYLTLDETRSAAAELLDSTTGDLTGSDAQRFQALTAHAEQLREQQRQTAEAGRNLVRRVQAGQLRTDHGSDRHDDGSYIGAAIPAAVQQRDHAMRTLDRSIKDGTLQARGAETVERLIDTGPAPQRSWAARWAATTGNPHYLRAVAKKLTDPDNGQLLWTTEESEAWRAAAQVQAERAMTTVDASGGFLIPMQLDPSILLSSSGSSNPLRQMARVVQTVGDVWNGVSSAGVVAHWYAEAAEVSDDAPTLAQPSVPVFKGAAWVPFSVEVEGDGAGFVAEIGRLLADSVEQLTATAYVVGTGGTQPTGFVTALVASNPTVIVTGDGSEVLASSDAFKSCKMPCRPGSSRTQRGALRWPRSTRSASSRPRPAR
jgi:predicted phage gp36 major capsid-like protein